MTTKKTRVAKYAAPVNPTDGVQLELFKTEQQSTGQTVLVKLEVTVVTGFSRKQRVKPLSPKPAAIIVQSSENARLFVYVFPGSLPRDWDLNKHGGRLGGGAKRERLFRLARENGWFDFRL